MRVDQLAPSKGSTKKPKRVGRGIGGKGGKTAGRGTKGQYARNTVARGFEGGQMPLKQRVPKLKGFNNPFRVEFYAVNLDVIDALNLPRPNTLISVPLCAALRCTSTAGLTSSKFRASITSRLTA